MCICFMIAENPLSESRVSGPAFRVPGLTYEFGLRFRVPPVGSQVSDPTNEMGPESRVSGPTNSPRVTRN